MTRLLPEEHEPVSRYIYSLCGVALDQSKAYLLEGRLGSLVEETGSGNFTGLVSRAKADSSRALDRRIVDAITTGESLFFRDTAPFDLPRQKIVPEWMDHQRSGPERIRGTDTPDAAIAPARTALFGRIERALEPEGCRIAGAMESLSGIGPRFESKRDLRSVFDPLKTAGAGRQGQS